MALAGEARATHFERWSDATWINHANLQHGASSVHGATMVGMRTSSGNRNAQLSPLGTAKLLWAVLIS